jgi:hypothetical protein
MRRNPMWCRKAWERQVGPNKKHREIYAAFSSGVSIEHLAEQYQIKIQTVASIVMAEKHRHAVSPLPEYKALRKQAVGYETMH